MLLGNDVSKWQGNINWGTYKNNTNFVILKASEGNGYTDPNFKTYQQGARDNGILLGYYHFARPDLGNDPAVEADWFLKVCGELRNGEMLCLDYEPVNQKQADVDWCLNWLKRVEFITQGNKPLIYLNQSQIRQFDWTKVVNNNNGLWIAAYTYDPAKNTFDKGEFLVAAMQQWTNQQNVPGIPAAADGNIFFGDRDTWMKYAYKKTVAPTEPPVPTEPVPQPPPPTVPDPAPAPNPCADVEENLKKIQEKANVYEGRLQEIRSILNGKGWWWTKYWAIKDVIAKTVLPVSGNS